ncbi:MAG: DUF881 domain-containing protein [Candidatus Limnocylindrales bacterium]
MGRGRGPLAVGLVLAILGFLVVAQLRSQAQAQGLAQLSVQDLTELVANVTARNNQLREEIQTLQAQQESLASAVQRGDTSSSQVRSDLTHILAWSGSLAVTGAGVQVTVDGALPGTAVGQLINELLNAGAEAIAVNGTRIVPGVVVTGDPGDLLIAGQPLNGPLVLVAVGQQETLAGSLSRAGGLIAQFTAQFPEVQVTVLPQDYVAVPASTRNQAPVLGRPML